MSKDNPLDVIYTADEAAQRLRLTTRGVIKLGRQHGLCARSGRNYLFSESDLLALWGVLREPAKSSWIPASKIYVPDFRLNDSLKNLIRKKKGPGRARWEATHAKNSELREATKAAIEKWKDDEPLDHSRRDAEYWTPDRKERRRLESLAKKNGWMART